MARRQMVRLEDLVNTEVLQRANEARLEAEAEALAHFEDNPDEGGGVSPV